MKNNELGNRKTDTTNITKNCYLKKTIRWTNLRQDSKKKKRHKHQHKESGEDTTRDMEEMMLKKKVRTCVAT